jgi:hypothetical protein
MPAAERRVRMAVFAIALGASVVLTGARQAAQRPAHLTPFAAQIAALSEPEGYFDTDNLISNEGSYLDVIPDLTRVQSSSGAYIGVGPDQNFTYIAHVRPSIAFIIDVRRDNLLLHLLFKALFELSKTRVEYLALLSGRAAPPNPDTWKNAGIDRLIEYIDRTPPAGIDALRGKVDAAIRRTGVPLTAQDFQTIDRFHRSFIEAGLSLQFQSTGRPPQSYYPTYRQLLAETDPSGRAANFLASEDSYQFVKSLQARDLVIPVIGDISGPSALAAIGRALTERHASLSALYVSNVEFYLFGQGTFPRFASNLGRLPHSSSSVLIRSIFGRFVYRGRSASRTQSIDDLLTAFAAGRIRQYGDIVGTGG